MFSQQLQHQLISNGGAGLMRKYYSEPEMEVKKYTLAQKSYITTSDLEGSGGDGNNGNGIEPGDGDRIDYFG